MQANWIGKSEGVRFAFPHDIRGADGKPIGDGRMYVFTTRADTIMGVTFCAVAAEHPLAAHAAQDESRARRVHRRVQARQRHGSRHGDDGEEGHADGALRHPSADRRAGRGLGRQLRADELRRRRGDGRAGARRARLRVRAEVRAADPAGHRGRRRDASRPTPGSRGTRTRSAAAACNRGKYDGLAYEAAVDAIAADLAAKGLGEKKTTFRLRDWGISRQRYWGTPIPIVHCPACGDVPVPDDQTCRSCCPRTACRTAAATRSPSAHDFVDCACPKCGGAGAARDRHDGHVRRLVLVLHALRLPRRADDGRRAQRLLDADGPVHRRHRPRDPAPALRALLDQGDARHGPREDATSRSRGCSRRAWCSTTSSSAATTRAASTTSRRKASNVQRDAAGHDHRRACRRPDGLPVEYGGIGTMSKSKLNGVDPQDMIDRYGADAARLFVMFAAPPEADARVVGRRRRGRAPVPASGCGRTRRRAPTAIARRGAAPSTGASADAAVKAARRELHLTLKQANYDYERIQYNTVVSAGMKMLNALEAVPADAAGAAALAARGPVDPAARALPGRAAHRLGAVATTSASPPQYGDLLDAPWPQVDPAALAQDEIELVLQVNGKLRGKLVVPAGADRDAIEAAARASAEVAKHGGRRAGEEGDRRAGAARQCRRLSARRARAARARRRRRRWRPRSRSPGCGFHLRGDVDLRVHVALHQRAGRRRRSRSSCKRALDGSGVNASSTARRTAQVILDIPSVIDDKEVLSLSGGGRVREYAADQARAVPRCTTPTATTGCRPARSSIRRTLHVQRVRSAGARGAGAAAADREMQTDAVQQIVRRLQAARKPALIGAAMDAQARRDLAAHLETHARAAVRRPRRRAAARDRGRRRDPRGRAPRRAATSARCWSSSPASAGTRSSPPTRTWACSARASSSTCASPRASPASKARRRSRPTRGNPNPDQVAAVTLPKLDRAAQASAWFAALAGAGVAVAVYPLDRDELPAWIAARLARQQQRASRDTLAFLADRCEGNLLRRAAGDREARPAAARRRARRTTPSSAR